MNCITLEQWRAAAHSLYATGIVPVQLSWLPPVCGYTPEQMAALQADPFGYNP